MPNHLINESSPYLLQHAHNPVDWYPWCAEALQKAQSEDKPIFLSIGYAACHWCHVMAHESFNDPQTASILNEHFVNIKVDREERPDLDQIYMAAVVAMTGQGGWPMSVFLTPQGEPFFGGTYFPPVRRYNMPSFREVLLSVIRVWKNDRDQVIQSGQRLKDHIQTALSIRHPSDEPAQIDLDKAVMKLAQAYDWKFGGWGSAPKFPQPMAVEFLLARAAQGDRLAGDMAFHALRAMAKGGMYDVVGGGFSRYSTDNEWKVPHFEKMLYDNAQLALAYLHAYLISGEASFHQVCEETLEFIQRELTHPLGGFYSSLDADSEGEEGRYYTWTPNEILTALNGEPYVDLYLAAYGVTEEGNFDGRNVLQRRLSDSELEENFGISSDQAASLLQRLNRRLLTVRQTRVRPATDDKIITSWNSLAMAAFAEAGRYIDSRYTSIAIRNAEFILNNLYLSGKLYRSWREGKTTQPGFLEDYAALVLGLISLYQSNPDPRWFEIASLLTQEMIEQFEHPEAGFYDVSSLEDHLIFRPVVLQDNATPCGNSLAANALIRMYHYTGESRWQKLVDRMFGLVVEEYNQYPLGYLNWLCAFVFISNPVSEVVILGPLDDPQTKALEHALWGRFRPNLLAAITEVPIPPAAPPLAQGRGLLNDLPTAYVCRNFTCHQPTNNPDELTWQLDQDFV